MHFTDFLLSAAIGFTLAIVIAFVVDTVVPKSTQLPETTNFQQYWYDNGAEISTYDITKRRYGDSHKGQVVLVFVTEHFLPFSQVKEDFSSPNKKEKSVPILKLNGIYRFRTGVYDYSVMQSVFSPIALKDRDGSQRTYKVATTFQDWCGQSFMQHNLRQGRYISKHFSYFEREGDSEATNPQPNALLEEEVWLQIRLNPERLLTTAQVVPSSMFLGLEHKPINPEAATGKVEQATFLKRACTSYTLSYKTLERTLVIYFESAFPHAILGWEAFAVRDALEKTSDSWRREENKTVLATRKKARMIDYWNRNQNTKENSRYRRLLGLRKGF